MDWIAVIITGLIGGILGVITTNLIYKNRNKKK